MNESHVDDVLAWFGGRQHGVAARAQLLDAGVGSDVIDRRLRSGALHLLHRGVYAVGHTDLPRFGRETAALLFCGPGSVLSHLSAAVVVEIARVDGGPIHVTTNGRNRRGTAGIVVHRGTAESVVRHGLPVTTPTRTLLDLAAIDHPRLEEAVNEALVQRLIHPSRVLDDAVGRRGANRLRDILATGPAPTRSETERSLLRLVSRAGLPRPETNVRLHGCEVDALWRPHKLVLEVDAYGTHGSRTAFERDRARDQRHAAAGYRVMRVTWRQLTDRPEAVVAHLARALG